MKRTVSPFLVSLLAVGCGSVDPSADSDPIEAGVVEQEIVNGTAISDAYSGILALQVFWEDINNWITFCSATLMTNNKAITAKHCIDDAGGRQIYAKMGNQRVPVFYKVQNATWDVAVIKFSSPMWMWNWNNTGFSTSPAQITTNGYSRAGYPGTNASLNNTSLLCLGYGGATDAKPQPPLTAAILGSTFGDGMNPTNQVHTWKNSLNQIQEAGDSGGPCLTGLSTVGAQLAFVQSGCQSNFPFCYGAGAESWAWWAYLVLLSI